MIKIELDECGIDNILNDSISDLKLSVDTKDKHDYCVAKAIGRLEALRDLIIVENDILCN